ncbi:MAG TPA: hypothetical protein VH678_14155 [Xanthobacteraceae bacterium]|jgi:hypothetical protein
MNVRSISLATVAVALAVLGAFIYGGGLFIGLTFGSFPWWLLTFFPVIGQLYLMLLTWDIAGTVYNLYTLALFVFGCLLFLFFMVLARD